MGRLEPVTSLHSMPSRAAMTGSRCSTLLVRSSSSAALLAVNLSSARASSSSDLAASSFSALYRSSLSLYFRRHSSRYFLIWSPPSGACVGSGPESPVLALLASRPGPRRHPSLLTASVLALGGRSGPIWRRASALAAWLGRFPDHLPAELLNLLQGWCRRSEISLGV